MKSSLKQTPSDSNLQKELQIAEHVRAILELTGEDPSRAGVLDTPMRYAKALSFLTSGFESDPSAIVKKAIFEESSVNGWVVVRDVEMFSLCEHHLLPFFGRVHIAYIPNKRVVGLSKIPRLVDAFARRYQVQERLTQQIGAALMQELQPKGVAVMSEASHMCMMMRGVEKQSSTTLSTSFHGSFLEEDRLRDEFYRVLNSGRK